ncbi:tripartite tricarboxylate transporter substrate binding protein [Xylophilus rhododendri]|uniref:Tripartite tricarboxylate transporter substrate binding protein n=2 Tax=Xylophilus rhododendri TaxID=2697032 RepID=A0A857JBH0_9BURK|nr:tripartite tricarboxylate transporter substrate binding protein [Xylophilus rhododendri]
MLALGGSALGQAAWPDRPVKIVVPYAAGGTTDYAARQIAQKLTEQFGQSFYVENKAGGSGTIGTQYVAKAPPDGSILLANDTTYTMLPGQMAKLPWDHAADLLPVTTILQTPVVLVVPVASPFKTLQELLAFARKNPGKLNFGSGGAGSSTHLQAAVFDSEAKVEITHVPYKGAGEAMLGLVANQVDVLITATPTALAQVRGGKARALAVTGAKRLPAMPEVPTFAEAGLPSYTVANWFGLAAPRGTSAQVIEKLQQAVVQALADPALRERLAQQGAQPGGIATEAFAAQIREETRLWTAAARAAGIQPQ